MYLVADKNNYGLIKKVEDLQYKKHEIVAEINIIKQLEEDRPYLISYDRKTNKAITYSPKELQRFLNTNYRNMKDYKLLFIEA